MPGVFFWFILLFFRRRIYVTGFIKEAAGGTLKWRGKEEKIAVVKDVTSGSYKLITVKESTGLAAVDNMPIASVKTSFSIELTADQVD